MRDPEKPSFCPGCGSTLAAEPEYENDTGANDEGFNAWYWFACTSCGRDGTAEMNRPPRDVDSEEVATRA